MDTAYQITAILSAALSTAFLAWYLWRFHGAELRAWWWDTFGPVIERERELAVIRRMWSFGA